jgi:hypothetical protein
VGKNQKYILELNHIDEEEIFDAYKQVYADNPKQEAELMLQVTPGNDHYRLYLQSKSKQVELLKVKGEIYLDE